MEGVASARCIPLPVVSVYICMRLFYFLSWLNIWDWCVSVSHDSGKVDLPTTLFSCCLNVVVLLSPPLTKYFQWCLHNVVHVIACIILLRQCLTLQGLQGATPVPTFCPCGFVLSCAYMSLGLCLFIVRWSVICCQDGCLMAFAKIHCPKSISVTILTSNAWEDTRLIWCISNPVGEHHWSLGTTFLGS